MKIINPKDAPVQPTERNRSGRWKPILDAVRAGQAAVIEAHEYTDESSVRNSVTISLRRWGVPVTIRKDKATGDLYVFAKPEETDGASPALTAIVAEHQEAQQ